MPDIDVGLTGQLEEYFSQELDKIISHSRLVESLETALAAWEVAAENAFSSNELLDAKMGRMLASICREIFTIVRTPDFPRSKIPYLLAAVSYVANQSDDAPDFETIIGLEDDAEVIARVIFALKLKDKLIQQNPIFTKFFEHSAVKAMGGSQ